jgi:hypothetical protein
MIKARTWKVANTALESRLEAPSGLRRHNQALVAPCHAARRPNHIKRPVLSRKTGVIPRGKEFPGKRGETCLELLGYAFGSHRLLCYRLMCVCPSACGRTIGVGWSRRSPEVDLCSGIQKNTHSLASETRDLTSGNIRVRVRSRRSRDATGDQPDTRVGLYGVKHGNSEKLLCTGRWGIVLPRGGHGAIHGAYSSRSRALPLHVSTPVSTSDHLEHAKHVKHVIHVKPTTSADQDWLL